MLLKKEISSEIAKELFNNSTKTLHFIAKVKWESGYKCLKCGHDNYCEGKTPASRRCTRCKKEESATSHTIFHNIKFPINKAFYIAYNVCVEGKEISTYDYSAQLGLNQMTCWKFRKRIKDCVTRHDIQNKDVEIQTILLSDF